MAQDVKRSLSEMKDVYEKTLGRSPPELAPDSYLPFPPGVDPVAFALGEVEHLRRLTEHGFGRPPLAAPTNDAFGAWPFAPDLSPWAAGAPPTWMPLANTYTKDEAFVVELELPGVTKEELEVFVQGTDCIVRGERKPRAEAGKERPLTSERTWGLFERRFSLPPNARPDEIAAKYTDGVLELTIPFDKEGKPLRRAVPIG